MAVSPAAATKPDLVTVEEFFERVPDGVKADLIDGVIYVASPDTLRSDDLTGFIGYLVAGFVSTHGLGRTTGSRYAYILTEYRAPEPDVAFVSAEHEHVLQHRGGAGGPDVAVEVVATDSRSRDYREKRRLYAEAGVSEYWILDPQRSKMTFLRLVNGEYEPIELVDGHFFHSTVLPGFWIDVRWLLAEPLPKRHVCLNLILAGPPDA